MKVLISGGGIAGPALAHWLTRLHHHVTIVERAPHLRAGGQQVDLKDQAIEVVERMGLLSKVREHVVDETGLQFIGLDGKRKALFPKREGRQGQGFTSEYEIMRGDLCRILYDETKEKADYRFGISIEDFKDEEDGVTITFADGTHEKFDLLVAADGQESRIRKRILDQEAEKQARRALGIAGCYFNMKRNTPEEQIATVFHATNRRVVSTRWHTKHDGQAYLLTMSHIDRIREVLATRDIDAQKQLFAEIFQDVGWQTTQLIEDMHQTSDFYVQEIIQIRSPTWSRGRIVLLGDAGYAPSPLTGMGTSLAFIGAYVLAGEIARQGESDLLGALKSYEEIFKPVVSKIQDLPKGVPDLVYPTTEWGIKVLYGLLGVASALRLDQAAEILPLFKKKPWQLPPVPCES